MNKTLADELDFWHFSDDKVLVFKDGSLGAGFKLSGRDLSCKANSELNTLTNTMERLFITAPSGVKFQLFYKLSPNVKSRIDSHLHAQSTDKEIYAPVLKSRVNFLKHLERKNTFYIPEIHLYVRWSEDKKKNDNPFKGKKLYEKELLASFKEKLKKFERFHKSVLSTLSEAGLNPLEMTKEHYLEELYEYFNLSRKEKHGSPDFSEQFELYPKTLIEKIHLSDLISSKDGVQIGDLKFKTITLGTLPENFTYAGMIHELSNLPFHFWMSQNVDVPNQAKELEKLQLARRLAHSMASGSNNVSDIESESKLSQIEDLLRELMEGSKKIVAIDTSVLVWGANESELQEKVDEVLKAFRKLNSSEGIVEDYAAKESFLKATPGQCSIFRDKKMKSSNASELLNVFGSNPGNNRSVCLIPNRKMSLFSYDPFDQKLPNWNGLIFGGSGSGKSFAIANLMLMFYGSKPTPKLIWIDNGASSKNLLEVLDGAFIDLQIDTDVSINMFDLPPKMVSPPPSKVKLILAALEAILKEDNQQGLPKREKALLEEVIFKVYENQYPKTPILSDLRRLLNTHESKILNDYAKTLFSWTKDTPYGRIVDRQTSLDLDKDLVTIETKGLDDYPDLQNLMLLLFTDFIKNQASLDIGRPTLLILDEAWKLFQTKSGLEFTLEAYRTFRKFNSGIWAISQNYKDFLANKEIANGLMPNTTSVLILRQQKIDWDDFKAVFDFNEAQVEAIKSLEIKKGEYSEFYLLQDKNEAILRLIPDPLSYWICTSDGKDKEKINMIQKENPKLKLMEVLEQLAKGAHA